MRRVDSLLGHVLASCFLIVGVARAEGFRVLGRYQAAYADGRPQSGPLQTVSFDVRVLPPRWRLEVTESNQVRSVYACNGTNTFLVVFDPQGAGLPALPGCVFEDEFPAGSPVFVTLLWLAFCSSDVLKEGQPFPAPFFNARRDVQAYLFRTEQELLDDRNGLPRRIRFLTDAGRAAWAAEAPYYLHREISETEWKGRVADYLERVGNGVLAAEYRVLKTATHNGQTIPTHAALTVYDYDRVRPTRGGPPQPLVRYEVQVKQILQVTAADCALPEAGGRRIDVGDYRLKNPAKRVDLVLYSITNGVWPQAITEEMRALLQRQSAFSLTRKLNHLSITRVLFTGVLVGVFLLPGFLLLWRQLRGKRETTLEHSHEK